MGSPRAGAVSTFTGEVPADQLGTTLVHEHVFVGHPELDLNWPHPEWNEEEALDRAVAGFGRLHALGVRTVVDLTVPGLGRDVRRVLRVAERTPVRLIAATGYYTADGLPQFFRTHRPGGLVGGPDPLIEMFLRDIREGIAGTRVRAGMLKVFSDSGGITPDSERVFAAAAHAHLETGVPLTTHSHAESRGGTAQQQLLARLGVPLDRVVIGHAGDSEDLDYLMSLADAGSFLGFDRFGMEHVVPDAQRFRTLCALLSRGYADRILLSHDAAFFSRMTPPSWRSRTVPHWHMETVHRRVLPQLRAAGFAEPVLRMLMIGNPRRLLANDVAADPAAEIEEGT
ncbi:phosphotriesterase-related protein [Arthrobacter sp. zg-Y820]|uniref:phosphotriesterase family protein n=1 Tax=unclassified Arthrobacter TaxID=235627 RepID=UPI002540072A|nr:MULTISPECIES: phosphotriesterase-related protein [unclassified Arthrobacter]MCC9195245.1 phosphotriesterase-related protein [Arthrobacter sp. zg-Y820]MDK1278104.1 phosphotriesterase-related protein [Arthrobacter sp. zg.Y820]WIB09994.1 phosphotriesterase-related protein [Arthrobacter sp. zg-Y820]